MKQENRGFWQNLVAKRFAPGKGIDAPPPDKGWKRVLFVLATHFWKLVSLNMLFVLFSVPVVTIPAALCGLNRATIKLYREGNCFVWTEFFKEFRANLFKAMPFGITGVAFMFASYYFLSVGTSMSSNGIEVITTALGILLLVFTVLFLNYAFVFLPTLNLSNSQIARNALIFPNYRMEIELDYSWQLGCYGIICGLALSVHAGFIAAVLDLISAIHRLCCGERPAAKQDHRSLRAESSIILGISFSDKGDRVMIPYEFWFVVGSQFLYGPKVLETIAARAAEITQRLNASGNPTVPVGLQGYRKNQSGNNRHRSRGPNYSETCAGLITWCHTFSPSKMWINGFAVLQKPYCHLATQYNREIPQDEIDMDFMNLNQAAHGDKEHGFIAARMRMPRKVIAGYWQDEDVQRRMACVDARRGGSRLFEEPQSHALRRQYARSGRDRRGTRWRPRSSSAGR